MKFFRERGVIAFHTIEKNYGRGIMKSFKILILSDKKSVRGGA